MDQWLKLLPIIIQHPQAEAFIMGHLSEAKDFVNEINAVVQKHRAAIDQLQANAPDLMALVNQLSATIGK
jgi:hypothetical protein